MALRVSRGIALPFLDHGIRRGISGQQHAPTTLYPPGKTRYPLYRRLGGPQGWSGWAENLAPPGFDPWTFQPVVSRYTDSATRPTYCVSTNTILYNDQQMNTIISQIITLPHVSTLLGHPQGACSQYLAKLHKYFI
jgi:hypothetical protein